MATQKNKTYDIVLGVEDFSLGDVSAGIVSRWRLHVTAVAGTLTVKAKIMGAVTAAVAANIVYPIGSTTAASTITAVGIYDIEASGLSVLLSSGTSCTFDYRGIEG